MIRRVHHKWRPGASEWIALVALVFALLTQVAPRPAARWIEPVALSQTTTTAWQTMARPEVGELLLPSRFTTVWDRATLRAVGGYLSRGRTPIAARRLTFRDMPAFTLPSGSQGFARWNPTNDEIKWTPFREPTLFYFIGTLRSASTLSGLNAALAASDDTDIVEVAANVTVTTPGAGIKIPNRFDTGWTLVRTGSYASLPAVGTRAHTDNANLMPTFTLSPGYSQVIEFATSARGWKFQGINFTMAAQTLDRVLLSIAPPAGTYNNVSQIIDYVIFQHCLFVNPANSTAVRGIACYGQHVIVRDSYIYNFGNITSDTQAIAFSSTPGMVLIENNMLCGKAENILAGGNVGYIGSPGVVGDIVIRRNFFYKLPAWMTNTSGGQCKNFFELKIGRRIVFEGNVCENHNAQGQQYDLAMTSKPQSANEQTFSFVMDILLRYNTFTNSAAPIQSATTAADPSVGGYVVVNGTQRVECCHNVWFSTYANFVNNSSNRSIIIGAMGCPNVHYHHNFIRTQNAMLALSDWTNTTPGLRFSDNVCMIPSHYGPIFRTGAAGNGDGLIFACGAGQFECAHNVTVYWSGTNPAWSQYSTGGVNLANAPYSNKSSTSTANIGMVDYANGNYRLSAGSAYKGIGTNGTDPGANMDRVDALTSGVRIV